jgi:hypothetical protein
VLQGVVGKVNAGGDKSEKSNITVAGLRMRCKGTAAKGSFRDSSRMKTHHMGSDRTGK